MKNLSRILFIAIPFIWTGLLLGISFIETPLKFRAPDVTTAIGVGIGRIVFNVLNKIEVILFIVLMFLAFIKKDVVGNHIKDIAMVSITGAIVLLQTFWLLPSLDKRAQLVQQNIAIPSDSLHVFYVLGEIAKVVLLISIGISSIKALSLT